MSEHPDEPVNQWGPPDSKGCVCEAAGARLCYLIRYDVDPADDEGASYLSAIDDGSCECACHHWSECDEDE